MVRGLRRRRRSAPGAESPAGGATIGVVVPVHGTAAWLPACLESLAAQTYPHWRALVIDDGSPDDAAAIAEQWSARDPRISLHRQANAGLGAARNAGVERVDAELLTFLDSDDVLPPTAYDRLAATLHDSGSDFVTGSVLRWESGGLTEPPWMARLHRPPLRGARIEERPELLGDVFAWNKLFRRSFYDDAGLSWPEGVRYEDQPTSTRAFLAGRFDVVEDVVYHWRIRDEGTSITQQRASLDDLRDRWTTKRMAAQDVLAHGSVDVTDIFWDRVLPGDLWRYFLEIPDAGDDWWDLLVTGIDDLWGTRPLVDSGLPPVHRVCGALVSSGRRADASSLMRWVGGLDGRPAPRTPDGSSLAIPAAVLDPDGLDPAWLRLRPHER